MPEPLSSDRERELLSNLVQLVLRRAKTEEEIRTRLVNQNVAADEERDAALAAAEAGYRQQCERIEADHQEARREASQRYDAEHAALVKQYQELQRDIPEAATDATKKAKAKRQEIRWEATTVFDATKSQPGQRLARLKKQAAELLAEIDEELHEATELLRQRRQRVPTAPPVPPEAAFAEADVDAQNPLAELARHVEIARRQVAALHAQRLPQLFEGAWPAAVLVAAAALLALPAGFALGWENPLWAVVAGGGGLLMAAGACLGLYPAAKRQSVAGYVPLVQLRAEAAAAHDRIVKVMTAVSERELAELVARRDRELQRAEELYKEQSTKIAAEQQQRLQEVEAKFQPAFVDVAARREQELAAIEEKFPRLRTAYDEQHAVEMEQIRAKHQRRYAENQRRHDRDYQALVEEWRSGFAQFTAGVAGLAEQAAALFPEWPRLCAADWQPPASVPQGIRFGQFEVNLHQMKLGVSEDENLRPRETSFWMPALLPFPQRCSLLIKANGQGRDAAVQLQQAVMLRLLTALPPGKVRFTILDPVGLGQNFSAFMHLADYDEQLVASRIWTERTHIEQRLADLTEHMETVFQKYLRNEFPTIEDYNRSAGEVAEPYRFLVVANFPTGFSEDAARRLASIASTGARCGVYTLISVDGQQSLPHRFQLEDLERFAETVQWKDGRFVWKHPDFERLPLVVESPPEADDFTRIVRAAGARAKDAHRVEVPFSYVAPAENQLWTADSRRELDVPLGRAGATKLQHMKLGRGTSQHALVAGKTGSGKSTLLHALITNAALRYSPDEVEFYLIDFKKGVEFKTYASLELPHARVIAIESEREFGLSVLQRLDVELKRRGELFREAGVQDIGGYRDAVPDKPLPRVLLIIDEFQEFFVEDDKLAQDASLLLDRLVRQGRAFGMHAVLGSQTLGGAYSLARTTLGQMAVRIALQCSEADAHLILSEENTAARLLSRPGEAIYNDANGLLEGNNLFQVVWLNDYEREAHLRKIQELAAQRSCVVPPPIVFEGNIPADVRGNPLLAAALARPTWDEPPRASQVWLGAAIAIKDPTAAVLRRQGGANLLIVGQRGDLALGMLSTAMLSLAAQHEGRRIEDRGLRNSGADAVGLESTLDSQSSALDPAPVGARFFILDGTPPDSPDAGFWRRMAEIVPHQVTLAGLRDVPRVIGELAAEVARREKEGDFEAPPWFVLAYDLGRLRDLRRTEDEFSFSFDGNKPVSASKQFGTVLREGPAAGIHTLAWCDTYNALQRVLDRQGLRDFDHRVLFQMSATDSSNLIDSPAAAKLGTHRAFLHSEDQAQLEKFRPYAAPPTDWLAQVKRQLAARSAAAPVA